LPHLIAWVEKQGFDGTSIRRLPGLADLTDPDLRVPEASVETAWRLATTFTGDAAIGVHVAESLPRGALDLVEYAFRSSASLAAGLERLARYGRVISDRVAARMETHGEGLLLLIRDTGSTALHPGRAEFALAAALKFARESSGEDITPLQVSFAHAAPEDQSETPSVFSQPRTVWRGLELDDFERTGCGAPHGAADEALSSIIRRRLDKALAERDLHDSGPLSGRVRHLMVEHLGETTLTPETVARALAVSRRTLSRHLADEDTSFRNILDDVRREFACALLQDRSLSIGDVAFSCSTPSPQRSTYHSGAGPVGHHGHSGSRNGSAASLQVWQSARVGHGARKLRRRSPADSLCRDRTTISNLQSDHPRRALSVVAVRFIVSASHAIGRPSK
jgi:AraC-like DNA-binding protein